MSSGKGSGTEQVKNNLFIFVLVQYYEYLNYSGTDCMLNGDFFLIKSSQQKNIEYPVLGIVWRTDLVLYIHWITNPKHLNS